MTLASHSPHPRGSNVFTLLAISHSPHPRSSWFLFFCSCCLILFVSYAPLRIQRLRMALASHSPHPRGSNVFTLFEVYHSPHLLCTLRFASGTKTPNAPGGAFSSFSRFSCFSRFLVFVFFCSCCFILFVSCAPLRIHGDASLSPQGMARGLRILLAKYSPHPRG